MIHITTTRLWRIIVRNDRSNQQQSVLQRLFYGTQSKAAEFAASLLSPHSADDWADVVPA